MFIVKYKKIFISISVLMVLLSFFSIVYFGLKVGIDFKGGSLTEVVYKESRPSVEELNNQISSIGLGNFLVQPIGDLGVLIKSRDITDIEHESLINALSFSQSKELEESSFNSIGPSVGKELTRKALISIILVVFVIILFIAYAFRKVSEPVSSWKYGFIAVFALLHDIIIPVGIFAFLSHKLSLELDTLFAVALLTILGLSLADTIVIFDRIRENLHDKIHLTKVGFANIVGNSLKQSFVRSLATSITSILVLVALIFFGPDSTKYFALILSLGIFFGTYSSIFLASPLLVLVEEIQNKKDKNTQK